MGACSGRQPQQPRMAFQAGGCCIAVVHCAAATHLPPLCHAPRHPGITTPWRWQQSGDQAGECLTHMPSPARSSTCLESHCGTTSTSKVRVARPCSAVGEWSPRVAHARLLAEPADLPPLLRSWGLPRAEPLLAEHDLLARVTTGAWGTFPPSGRGLLPAWQAAAGRTQQQGQRTRGRSKVAFACCWHVRGLGAGLGWSAWPAPPACVGLGPPLTPSALRALRSALFPPIRSAHADHAFDDRHVAPPSSEHVTLCCRHVSSPGLCSRRARCPGLSLPD